MGFSWAVSGMMMPALVLVSAANGFSRSRSCKGLSFMIFPRLKWQLIDRKGGRRVSTREAPLELRRGGGVEGHGQKRHFAVVAAAAHLAVAVEPGHRGAFAQGNGDAAAFARRGEKIADRLEQLVDPLARQGRNRILAGP